MFNGCACVSHLADKRKRWGTLQLLIDHSLFMVLTYKSLTITLILCVCLESAELITKGTSAIHTKKGETCFNILSVYVVNL